MSTYGAVQESCDPYNQNDESCKTSCAPVLVASEMWVLGGNAVPPTDVLKNWLQSYGPLYITIDAGTNDAWGQELSNYNGSYTIYKPMSSPNLNHAVLLVGWNDGLTHAGGSGAWIVKNSWGTNWGGTCGYGSEKGYFTIAYGSAGIGTNAAVVRDWRPAESAGKLLHLDEGGFQGTVGWNGSYGPHGLARLTPQQNGTATQVEFWTAGPGTVDIALYDTFNGQAPSGLLWQRQGLSIGFAGYHSVNIDAPVGVQAGNDVNVLIRFNTTGVSLALPIDHRGPVSANQSFASLSGGAGTWVDLSTQNTPMDIGIRLRIGSGSAPTPTPTHTPPPPTPTFTPGPPTKTPTYGPSPTRMRVRLPMMLRQWTVVGPATNTPPAPTATHTPPAQPTATPTAEAGEVYILGNASGWMDEDGGLHTFGEVQNDTAGILTDVWVTVRIYDEDDNELDSQGGYVLLDNVLPGQRACFHLYHDPLAGAAQFNFDPPDYATGGHRPPSLEFVDHSASYRIGRRHRLR